MNELLLYIEEITGIWVFENVYETRYDSNGKAMAKPTKWITFNYPLEEAYSYSEDEPDSDVITINVHLFIPKQENYTTINNQIRAYLEAFGHVSIQKLYEKEVNMNHIVYECDYHSERS